MVKKPWYKKWWVWVAIAIVAVGIAANNNGKDTSQVTDNDLSSPIATEQPATQKPDAETPEPTENTERTITDVGGSVTTKNFVVTVEELNKIEPDTKLGQPKEGHEFVEVVLLIENKSNKDYSVSSILMFEAYCDGLSVNESLKAQVASKRSTMNGGLAAGKKLRGALAYELPKDWGELEILVDLTKMKLGNDGEVKIILQNK